MKIHYYFIILLVLLSIIVKGQNENTYTPITYKGDIPEEFLIDPIKISLEQIENEEILTKDQAIDFYTYLNYEKRDLFLNSYIYFNDELTSFVRMVADNLLEGNDKIRSKIKIYVTRFSSPNSIALPDGTIFVNIGLLSLIQNEAQLALILSHEIAHVELNHSIKAIQKMNEIEEEEVNTYNIEGNIFRKLKYSRENEFQADGRGLELLIASKYNAQEGITAFKFLKDSIYLNFETKIDYKKWFDKEYSDTSADLSKLKVKVAEEREDYLLGRKTYDDLFQTHPDIDKRFKALEEILNLSEYSPDSKVINVMDEKQINKIQYISSFELVENLYSKSDFGICAYLCLQLLNQYPENKYLITTLAKSLYWLSYYTEIENQSKVLELYTYVDNHEYRKFYSFFKNTGLKEFKELTYQFIKSRIKTMKTVDEFNFYYALAAESFLGKEMARFIYNQYLTQFPDGEHRLFVEEKTKL